MKNGNNHIDGVESIYAKGAKAYRPTNIPDRFDSIISKVNGGAGGGSGAGGNSTGVSGITSVFKSWVFIAGASLLVISSIFALCFYLSQPDADTQPEQINTNESQEMAPQEPSPLNIQKPLNGQSQGSEIPEGDPTLSGAPVNSDTPLTLPQGTQDQSINDNASPNNSISVEEDIKPDQATEVNTAPAPSEENPASTSPTEDLNEEGNSENNEEETPSETTTPPVEDNRNPFEKYIESQGDTTTNKELFK